MSYVVNITDDAGRDLKRIYRWYVKESKSESVASRWYDGFLEKLETLKDFPESCSLAQESDRFDYELRQLLYGSRKRKTHRALFRIVGDTVEILTVRHLSQRDVTPDDVS